MVIEGASGLRRLSAFGVDAFLVALYMGLVFFGRFVLTAGKLELRGLTTPGARQLVGALTLTLPVALYFAIAEASARQGTVGKLATRLKVTGLGGERLGFARSLLRTGLKLLPWELAHAFVHRVPKTGEVPAAAWIAFASSLLLAGVYLAGIVSPRGRPLYDVIAGARVIEVAPDPLQPRVG
jgi:uncharacterized RDD family membrane protein YckC